VPPGFIFTNISVALFWITLAPCPLKKTFLPQVEDDRTLRAWPCQASVLEVKNSTSQVNLKFIPY
jgi:hypothetical protein